MISRILNRLFKLEEINGANRCPTYLYRWTLLKLLGYGVYLHRFVGDDWSKDCHDHPKRFVSLMLWGRYRETVMTGHERYTHCTYSAPWLRSFPATHAHRVTVEPGEECWTLVIVLPASRPWGFWHQGCFIPWREYVTGRYSYLADLQAVCAGVEDPVSSQNLDSDRPDVPDPDLLRLADDGCPNLEPG